MIVFTFSLNSSYVLCEPNGRQFFGSILFLIVAVVAVTASV